MKVSIDRIEGAVAVLIAREDPPARIHLPVSFLPDGCREGDVLEFSLEPDPAATEAAEQRVCGLVERLIKKG